MKVRQGPRGKFFTEVVRKLPIRARIQTSSGIVTGTIHVHPDHRTLEELNEQGEFLAVTEARVEAGGQAFETDFIAVNKTHIQWVVPIEFPEDHSG